MKIFGLGGLQSIRGDNNLASSPQMDGNYQINFPKTRQDKHLLSQLEQSPLDDRVPTKTSLRKLGFKKGLMDMNGG